MKIVIPIVLLVPLLALFVPQAALADRDCSNLLKGECVGCHEKEKYCENIGKSEKFWKGMLNYMESNGADLTSAETATLTQCLSSSSEIAQNICK